jgi:predicted methyltransferase
MKPLRILWTAAIVIAGGASLAQAQQAAPLSAEQIATILASPDRTAADKINDLRRKPQPMLEFIGIRPGIVAFDLSSAGGYTTELLARVVGPSGTVYGQGQARDPNRAGPAAPEGNSRPDLAAAPPSPPPAAANAPRPFPAALLDRSERMVKAGVAFAPITGVVRPFADPFPPEITAARVDLVTLMFNYHDLGYQGVDRAAMNKAAFAALKPGGFYVIADHAGRAGTGISEAGTLHRIEEAFLRQEVEAAGFKLAAEGNFLRNPNDPRDKNTPNPPQPKDEFVLKFVKP